MSARWQFLVARHLYGLTLLGQYHSVRYPIAYFASYHLLMKQAGLGFGNLKCLKSLPLSWKNGEGRLDGLFRVL